MMNEAYILLVLKDLCARLPYGVKCNVGGRARRLLGIDFNNTYPIMFDYDCDMPQHYKIEDIKPYLRPLSSMTEEEILDLYKIAYDTWYSDSLYYKNEEWITFRDSIKNNRLCFKNSIWLSDINKVIDWLNKKGFDYHGLIPMGLAIEAPKDMYN